MSRMKIGKTTKAPEGLLYWSHYTDTGETALWVYSERGELLYRVTVNVEEPARRSGEDEIWVKMWAENEGVVQALLTAGIATETPEMARCGYSAAVLCKLTPAAIQDRLENSDPGQRQAQADARAVYAAAKVAP